MTPPILTTPRLTLRELTFADLENVYAIFSDPEAMRYYPSTRDRDETRASIQRNLSAWSEKGHGFWAVDLSQSGEYLGQAGLLPQHVDGVDEVEVAYQFQRRHWNKGYATEAAAAARDYGFDVLGRRRLISLIDPANQASRRVAEKLGLRVEKEVVMWDKQILVYSIEREERSNATT